MLAEYEAALADFDRAIDLQLDHVEIHHDRILALIQLKRYKDACAAVREALQLDSVQAEHVVNELKRLRRLLSSHYDRCIMG